MRHTAHQEARRWRARARWTAALALTVGAGLCGGCWTPARVDRAVYRTVRAEARDNLGPFATNAVADAQSGLSGQGDAPDTVRLDLPAALNLAQRYSRSFQSRREQLYLSGLSTLGTLRTFSLQYAGTLEYVMNWPEESADNSTVTAGINAKRLLPTGGTLSAQAASTYARTDGLGTNGTSQADYRTSASMELRQPLLAGAGYEASHAGRIQAERDLVYAVRDFALERQDFAIRTLRSFYNLLTQKAVLENTRHNADQSTYLRRRSEALFRVRQAAAIDVLRAQQQELSASNSLSQAESQFEIAVSRYLVDLGLPPRTRAEVSGEIPPLAEVDLNIDRCLELAFDRRLDLASERDRVEDARRSLRVARNGLRPRLDAYGRATASGESEDSLGDATDTRNDVAAGVVLDLPLDLRDERDAVRRAQIALTAAERGLTEKRDTIEVGIRESFRQLETYRVVAGIERRNMELAERRANYASLQFKAGNLSNRDLVEAQNELLSARNSYTRALVQYEQQRIQLLRDVGLLDIDRDGHLVELTDKGTPTP